jgi:hypothetical protein
LSVKIKKQGRGQILKEGGNALILRGNNPHFDGGKKKGGGSKDPRHLF